jgi:hypothetical protein
VTDPRNLRLLVGEIRSALDGWRREDLAEVLGYVFKEYVVEAGHAVNPGALATLDAKSELDGLSFAQVVTWLQRHLDLPELQQFEVQGERVSVRAGGRVVPIETPRAESATATLPPPATTAPPVAVGAPAPPPPAAAQPSPPSQPSPAIVMTPSGPVPAPQPLPRPTAQPTSAPAQPSSPPPSPPSQSSSPSSSRDEVSDADSRFSRLEVD